MSIKKAVKNWNSEEINFINISRGTVCFIDLGKLKLIIISLPWSKWVKQTVVLLSLKWYYFWDSHFLYFFVVFILDVTIFLMLAFLMFPFSMLSAPPLFLPFTLIDWTRLIFFSNLLFLSSGIFRQESQIILRSRNLGDIIN